MDSGQAPRACTRVWIGVDSGVPVRKLTRYHVRFLLKVDFGLPRANFSTQDDFGLPRANFSTQDDLDLEASRIFSTDTTQKYLV